MKTIKIYVMLLMTALIGVACNPIEDESLREKYYENAGTPITKAELQAAISITQPLPNLEGVVEGDQYVVFKNARPDIIGVWHYTTSQGEKTVITDSITIVYDANNTFSAYFVALSANAIVQTDPVSFTITNCFDKWDNLFSGAEDKSDKSAKKTWEFWSGKSGMVYQNGMYGNWLAADVYGVHDNNTNTWSGLTTINTAGAYTMEFAFDGNKLTVYNPDGSVLDTGTYSFTHDVPTDAGISNGKELAHPQDVIMGQLITTIDLPGSDKAWNPAHTYWLWLIDEDHMAVVLPGDWTGADFWDADAWYGFYQVKK
jgi:hypothetical protein